MKRYQECNLIEKAWRLRHYCYIPFRWTMWKLFNNNKDGFNGETMWRVLIGVAQCDMNWTYTREEVNEYIKKQNGKK